MAKIKVLAKEVSELIAAGEVIDRPCSVIKELLENAIDSGAFNIVAEIKNGGRTYMRVTDNGNGIEGSDLPTAFLRHATSKISRQSDLESITSLGFRGEALASICAVSRVSIMSKKREQPMGARIVNEGGEVKLTEECGCPDGTTVLVRDLFFNVPARLKFLKKDVTEGNAIASMINKLALSHPEISFKFIRDNKQELITAGDGNLYTAIFNVYGRDFAKSLIEVDHEHGGVRVTGYIIKPLEAKSKRTFQNFFVNGRYVKTVTCMVSLEEAYRNQIMVGKFPACVLSINIAPSLVDVNVHPAKVEVKFSDEKLVYDAVYFAVKNALMNEETPSEIDASQLKHFTTPQLYGFKQESGEQTTFKSQPKSDDAFENIKTKANDSFFTVAKASDYARDSLHNHNEINTSTAEQEGPLGEISVGRTSEKSDKNVPFTFPNEFKYINADSFKTAKGDPNTVNVSCEPKPVNKVLGEVFNTYIVVERGDDMFLVDKHAAHERINFERIKSQLTELNSQMLVSPVKVMLEYNEYDAIMQNLNECKSYGFVVEDGGAPNVNVLGLPVIIDGDEAEEAVGELAKNFLLLKKSPQIDVLDELCHSIACKASIKGNIPSKLVELEALCEKAFDESLTKYCPHGRPIFIKLSRREIEKLFKRIV